MRKLKLLTLLALMLGSIVTTQAQTRSDCYEEYGTPKAWPNGCNCESCPYDAFKALIDCLCEENKKITEQLSSLENLDGYTLYDVKKGVALYYIKDRNVLYFKAVNNTNQAVHVKVFDVAYTTSRNLDGKKSIIIGKVNPGIISGERGIFSSTFNNNVIESWKMAKWEWRENAYTH